MYFNEHTHTSAAARVLAHDAIARVSQRMAAYPGDGVGALHFAYGRSPSGLADGVYVTRPLTRTEVQRDGSAGQTTTLTITLESIGIQGVSPLEAASSAALGKGPQVQAQCLQLTALPNETAAAELCEYYRTWIKLNGRFATQIRAEHAAFFNWVGNER